MKKPQHASKKAHEFTEIAEFAKAMRHLVNVPKEAVERAEKREARKKKR